MSRARTLFASTLLKTINRIVAITLYTDTFCSYSHLLQSNTLNPQDESDSFWHILYQPKTAKQPY